MTKLIVDKIIPQSGTSIQIGDSGDTINIPAGVTFENLGTATGFGTSGIVGVKNTAYLESAAFSGSNWQEFNVMRNTYTASSTSNKLLFLCMMNIAISATSCNFKFYDNTTSADIDVADADGSRLRGNGRSHVNSTSWGNANFFTALHTPVDTNAHEYSVYFVDHNAGGIRVNSNLNNSDSSTTDNSRATSQFCIIEFDSGVL